MKRTAQLVGDSSLAVFDIKDALIFVITIESIDWIIQIEVPFDRYCPGYFNTKFTLRTQYHMSFEFFASFYNNDKFIRFFCLYPNWETEIKNSSMFKYTMAYSEMRKYWILMVEDMYCTFLKLYK